MIVANGFLANQLLFKDMLCNAKAQGSMSRCIAWQMLQKEHEFPKPLLEGIATHHDSAHGPTTVLGIDMASIQKKQPYHAL